MNIAGLENKNHAFMKNKIYQSQKATAEKRDTIMQALAEQYFYNILENWMNLSLSILESNIN